MIAKYSLQSRVLQRYTSQYCNTDVQQSTCSQHDCSTYACIFSHGNASNQVHAHMCVLTSQALAGRPERHHGGVACSGPALPGLHTIVGLSCLLHFQRLCSPMDTTLAGPAGPSAGPLPFTLCCRTLPNRAHKPCAALPYRPCLSLSSNV